MKKLVITTLSYCTISFITTVLLVAILISLLSSCQKESGQQASEADIQKSENFKTQISTNAYRAEKYYSKTPIDYITTDDEVKSETDLWGYVSLWIKDDSLVFKGDQAIFYQLNNKINTDNSPTISRSYSIGADKDGVYMNFVNHEYNPLKYRLESFDETGFVIYAEWQSKTVYSRFAKIN